MISTLITAVIATTLASSQVEPLRVVAKHNGEGIEIRWFPPAPEERGDRWAYRVERIDSAGLTLPITHMPLQAALNVATLRDRLGPFAETYLGVVTQASPTKRINEATFNEALANPVSRHVLLRFAVLYPEVANIMGWRRVDQDLQPGKTYTYRVIAVDRAAHDAEHVLGEARAVAARSGLGAPSSATVSQPAPDRLKVTWPRDVAREKSEAVLRYKVYRREGSGPWVALNSGLISSVLPSATSSGTYIDRHVLAGRTYQYAVTATDLADRESARTTTASMTVSDQRPPPPPLDVELQRGPKSLTLTWLVAGLPSDVTQFEVLKVKRPRPEGGPREAVKVMGRVGAKTGTYTIRLPGLGRHEYAVRSVDGAGNRGPLSVAVGVHIDRGVRLKTPTGVRVKLNKEQQVEIAWRTTPGTDAVGYVVERAVVGSSAPPTRISPATLGVRDKAFVDSAPPLDGPPLAYRVFAVDAASAHSSPSPWASLPDLRRAPAAVLFPPARSADGVHLRWDVAPSPVAKGFQVQVQVDGGRWSNLPGRGLGADARQVVDGARRPVESLVRYRIVSVGGASGPAIRSNTVALRQPAASVATPSGLSARCLSGGVELRWAAASGASSYEVQRAYGTADFVSRGHALSTTWTDRAVVEGKHYRYRLVARHHLNASGLSEPVTIVCSAH